MAINLLKIMKIPSIKDYLMLLKILKMKRIDKSDLEKIDSLVNRRIREIAKKIKFKFDKDDEKRFFEFTEKTNYDIEIIENL